MARCGSLAGWSKAHPQPFHICCAPDPGGEPLLRRCLRQGSSVPFADCEPQGRRKLRPSQSSKALCLSVRSAVGAPRRLRQRYASCLVERSAPDRAAVIVIVVLLVFVRTVFTCNRAITGRASCRGFILLVVLPLYTLYILLYAIRYTLLEVVDTINIMILGDGIVRCLATILPGPALSSSHSGP